ncbi:MAG: AAA family ATPase [Bacteroidales bacterium]|nr:AAA family ATPase [Bacteroidales bacterium]
MIVKLTNFSNKSFKGYTNPNDLLFKEKNIVFGYNGKGKSSFAIGLREEFLKNSTKSEQNIRIFNKEYIAKSLLLENSEGKLKGVEVSFGKKGVDTKNEIKKLESEIISKTDLDTIILEIGKIRASTRKEIDSIHEKKKGNASIQKKSSNETTERVIELYTKDYTDAQKIENDDDKLSKISGDDTIEKQIKQLEALDPLSISKISIVDISEVKTIFNEKFGKDIEIPEYEIIQWMEEGLKVHQESDNCKFCGGQLDYLGVKAKIEQYKENKKHKAVEKIRLFQGKLQRLQQEINAIESVSKTYISTVEKVTDSDFKTIFDCKTKIDTFISILQTKIDNMENDIGLDFAKLESILGQEIDASVFIIDTQKRDQLTELRKKQGNLEVLVKGAIGLEIKKSQSIKDKFEEIKIKETDLKTKQDTNAVKQQEIQKLKQENSLTKDFADFVSKILNDINISLKVELDADERNYIIKSFHEDVSLTINDISEGEKNLLALLFFYYELFNDAQQKQIKTEIELIVADDPISSMDDSNKFYILELMKNLLNLPNLQVFVLSHSWDDFCNLSWGKKVWVDDSKYATFEIRKNNGQSELAKLTKLAKPYKHLFKEIYDFSQKQESQIGNDCEIYHFPNVMRRIFEEWYSFKIGKELNLTNSQQDRLANDFNITEEKEKTKLGTLLKVCNILSHSINNSKNPQEIHLSSRFLMNLIEKNDTLHFNNMKQ